MGLRIPGSITTRRFYSNYSTSLSNLNRLMEQNTNYRSFSRVSDNPAAAAKAFMVRNQLARNEMYTTNLQNANNILTTAESSARGAAESIKLAAKTLIGAVNGTNETNREVLALQFESYRDEIIKNMNNSYADRYLFCSGTTDGAPFKMNGGQLEYNGVDLATVTDPAVDLPFNEDIYIDIGIGLTINATGEVDPQTALKISTSGVKMLGYGLDADGLENNVCNALTKIAELMRAPTFDSDTARKYIDKLNGMHSDILVEISGIGNRVNYIESNIERLADETFTLTESQNALEFVDPAAAITALKTEETAYKTLLQIGPRLMQNTLFDYLR